MTTRNDLFQKMVALISNNLASVSVILSQLDGENNGFIKELEDKIESSSRKVLIMPKMTINEIKDEIKTRTNILAYLKNNDYLMREPEEEYCLRAASKKLFWKIIEPLIDSAHLKTIVFIITDVNSKTSTSHEIYDLYSNLRKFCTEWRDSELSIHFITTGSWEPAQLENDFLSHRTSWPFFSDYNLLLLPDLTVPEVFDLLNLSLLSPPPSMIHAEYLWELTNGDPWCVNQIINNLKLSTCEAIFKECINLIHSKQFFDKIDEKIKNLTPSGKKILTNLLLGIKVRCNEYQESANELILLGLVYKVHVHELYLIELKNWVIESTIRYQNSMLIANRNMDIYSDFSQLIPPITCLNREAYNLLYEVENLLRNQVILRLYANQSDKSIHPLTGITTSQSVASWDNPSDDMFSRSLKYYERRVKNSKYVDTHTAQIGFSGLSNLIEIIEQLIFRIKDPVFIKLKPYRDNLTALKDIRDAIAHNQLISESSYELIVELRDQLTNVFCVSQ